MKRDLELPAAPVWRGDCAVPVRSAFDLSVIVPTFNEAGNVELLVAALERALQDLQWEVIFVDDDSSDGTTARLVSLALTDRRVRVLRRIGRRGLASACVEGLLSTSSPLLAVMDADLQHDESLLPRMFDLLAANRADVVVGTRYAEGGGCAAAWNPWRRRLSGWATGLTHRVLRLELTDPMSGFFMVRRTVLEGALYRLSNLGFKMLLDLLLSAPVPPRVAELPYNFRCRQTGRSKLDLGVGRDFVLLLLDKTVGQWVPLRVLSFAAVGLLGVAVNLGLLKALLAAGVAFVAAQTLAVGVSMCGNFLANNALTYADRRLSGWRAVCGLAKFVAACGLGAVANVGVASLLYAQQGGWMWSGLAGIAVGVGWNYIATSLFVWSPGRRRGRSPA
jgi:dolichol-phosphate mannosyltransferase